MCESNFILLALSCAVSYNSNSDLLLHLFIMFGVYIAQINDFFLIHNLFFAYLQFYVPNKNYASSQLFLCMKECLTSESSPFI